MLISTDSSGALIEPRWIIDQATGDFIGVDAKTGALTIYRTSAPAATESTLGAFRLANFTGQDLLNTTLGIPFQEGGRIGNTEFVVKNPPEGTPLIVQPLSHDIDNIRTPVAV